LHRVETEGRPYTGRVTRPAEEGLEPQPAQEDPRAFFRVLWRRKWILLLCITLIPAAAYVYSERLTKTYEASVLMQVQANAVDGGLPVTGDFVSAGTTNTATIARLIETDGVADEASRLMGDPSGSLRGAIQATDDEDTGLITITATATDPERAARVANTFARAVRVTRRRQGIRRVDAAIGNVQEELDDLPPNELIQREQLSENLQGLRTLRAAQGQNAQVVQPATPPASPVSPNPERNTLLALVAALLIGAGAVALAERLDRRIHDPRDLERLTGTPLLARVPTSAFPGAAPDVQLPIVFQTLRDSLTYFNLDVPLTSLLVMSPIKGDGKTSVATHLAVAYARAGKRVILLDADLRSPQVAARMGGDPSPGLSEVLTGGAETEEALQSIEPFESYLRILAGGSVPPNPSEMLGSARMTSVLAQLTDLCDLVLIDTAPLLVVSDAFPLLDQVAGIVGVARLDQTNRDAIERAIEVSVKAGGRVLGMVATGGKPGESYGYGYGYRYGKSYGQAPDSTAAPPVPRGGVLTNANGNAASEAGVAAGSQEPEAGSRGPETRRGRRVRPFFRSG
jgi:capsular exopolysaccharide synthesis family protein